MQREGSRLCPALLLRRCCSGAAAPGLLRTSDGTTQTVILTAGGGVRGELRSLRGRVLAFLWEGKVQDDEAKRQRQQQPRDADQGLELEPLGVDLKRRVREDWHAVQGPQPHGHGEEREQPRDQDKHRDTVEWAVLSVARQAFILNCAGIYIYKGAGCTSYGAVIRHWPLSCGRVHAHRAVCTKSGAIMCTPT